MDKSLASQLQVAIKTGKIKVKHFDGEEAWSKKFKHFYNKTKSVSLTLDIIYGPNGGINNYQGSIYRNSNVKVNKQFKKVPKKSKREKTVDSSKVFDFIKGSNNAFKAKKA